MCITLQSPFRTAKNISRLLEIKTNRNFLGLQVILYQNKRNGGRITADLTLTINLSTLEKKLIIITVENKKTGLLFLPSKTNDSDERKKK